MQAGFHTTLSGQHQYTQTEQLLHRTGMSPQNAALADSFISIGGMGGSILAKGSIHRANLAYVERDAARASTQELGKRTKLNATPKKHQVQCSSHMWDNPLTNTTYRRKVMRQMRRTACNAETDFHAFPRIVDNYASLGSQKKILGGDGVYRLKIELEGGYVGRDGVFEWIIEPDRTINAVNLS